jgi:hypothetical protein
MIVEALIAEVVDARERFLATVGVPSVERATFKPAPDEWCIAEVVEHMTLAERTGTSGIWKALEGMREGRPVWSGDPIHRGKPIDVVIAETWKEREVVPAIAAPTWGGPIAYWITALRAGQVVLEALGVELERAVADGISLESIIYPHAISGPLDVIQRLEFMSFHLDRHREQVWRIQEHPSYPAARRPMLLA